ncbi:MAG: hypothetical protein JOZ94_16470 [Xanthobacteraceae bacterium]|nr:hypothetical protein [Xanthobacteraceae bacterium]MBV9629383.1 hypothetical protein [Xanthobacteraceae bacterium]
MTALLCLLSGQQVAAQDLADLAGRPDILMQRAYVDYICVRGCQQRQQTRTSFVSSDDFISFEEMRRARSEVSSIEHMLIQIDPKLDLDTLWKKAANSRESQPGSGSFAALLMLGLKSNNERCRYYLDDLERVVGLVPHLMRADKDF